MYILYQTGVIKATNTFRKVVMIATAGIGIFYLISIVMRLFGSQMPYLHDSSPIGIGISLVIVVVAALNLILDFDMIEQGVHFGHADTHGQYREIDTQEDLDLAQKGWGL